MMSTKKKGTTIIGGLKDVKEAVDNLTDKVHEIDKGLVEHRVLIKNQTEANIAHHEELKRIGDVLQENTNQLREHIRRTDILEDEYRRLNNKITPVEEELKNKKTIKEFFTKNIALIGKISAAIAAVLTLCMKFRHFWH